jgi:hypothetical protein
MSPGPELEAVAPMTITLGQLVSDLYDKYEESYRNETLAMLAARIVEILRFSTEQRRVRAHGPVAYRTRTR